MMIATPVILKGLTLVLVIPDTYCWMLQFGLRFSPSAKSG